MALGELDLGAYYHIHVLDEKGDWYEADLSRDTLVGEIIEPYLFGQDFYVEGHLTSRKSIRTIRVAETDQESGNYRSEMENRGRGVLIDNRYYLVHQIGRDVTREFISSKKLAGLTRGTDDKEYSSRVFLVHGHDELPKEQLARMLTEVGLEPIILHERPDKGRTIIEKFEEECKDVGLAFVIITPDDVGMDRDLFQKTKPEDYINRIHYRARQNVVFELGFFYGKMGRKRVCCLHKGDTEVQSDISGVLFIRFENSIREKYADITKELKAAGYKLKI